MSTRSPASETSPSEVRTQVAHDETENSAFNNRAESTKLSHTPGPWQSRHEWDWDGLCSIIGNIDGDPASPSYTNICDLDEGCDEFLANRNLICAAPNLLEVVRTVDYLLNELADERTPANVEMTPAEAALVAFRKHTRAAISKAEGK